ncbi:MAG TPA: hypothetical protein P5329_05070 [Candidatus Competibacteraceae bacterium]|nr:hypothetical protein [Candidatus Competibacteraceae bacterium]
MESMARLLIVDDDPAAIAVLDHALEGMGEVRCATSGADALALLAQYPIDRFCCVNLSQARGSSSLRLLGSQ